MKKYPGVLDSKYHDIRQNKRAPKYRLARRTQEVIDSVISFYPGKPQSILDVGTADAAMLKALEATFKPQLAVGLEYCFDLLLHGKPAGATELLCGNAQHLPFQDDTFDLIVATAVIEHVPSPEIMMNECARVLKPDGIIVITTPDPKLECIAHKIGLLEDDEDHNETMDLARLRYYCTNAGLDVRKTKKFMFSPVGFPFERTIERIFGPLGLDYLMANQLAVASAPSIN